MFKLSRYILLIVLPLLVMSIVGCGGGGSNTSSGNTALQASGTVGSTGGTIEVTDASNPLYGLKMEVPAGALNDTTSISIQPYNGTLPLPQGIVTSETIISLSPEGLQFNKAISITIPYASDTVPIIVSYSPTTGAFETLPITSIDEQNKKITVTTTHFSFFQKVVDILVEKDIDTIPFNIQNDAFKINNDSDITGTPNASLGACWGFATYAKWYFDNKKAVDGKLWGRYGCNEKWVVSDAQDLQTTDLRTILKDYLSAVPLWAAITRKKLYADLLLTNRPQILGLCTDVGCPKDATYSANAVLVYGTGHDADGQYFKIYDSVDNSTEYKIRANDLGGFQAYVQKGGPTYKYFVYLGAESFIDKFKMQVIYDKYKNSIVTYSTADIQGTWNIHSLASGPGWNGWCRDNLNVSSSGTIAPATELCSDGTTNPQSGMFSIDSNGMISLSSRPSFQGYISKSKDLIVGTMTVTYGGGNSYYLTIGQKYDPTTTYTTSDLAGTWIYHDIVSGSWNGWCYAQTSIDRTGQATATRTCSSLTTDNPTFSYHDGSSRMGSSLLSIDSNGIVTDSSDSDFHGFMNKSKNLIIATGTSGTEYGLLVMQKADPNIAYSGTDLPGAWYMHNISAGPNLIGWYYCNYDIDSNGNATCSNIQSSNGRTVLPTSLSVNQNGTIGSSSTWIPSFHGFLNSGKDLGIAIQTDNRGNANLSIFQK